MTGEFEPPPAAFDEQVWLAGHGQPYELDAWTGKTTPIANYVRRDERLRTRIRLAPGETMIIALASWDGGHEAPGGGIHATSSTADEVPRRRPRGTSDP